MDLTNLDLSEVNVAQGKYHSDIYEQDFPLFVPGRAYVKLDPLPKRVLQEGLEEFLLNIPGRNFNVPILRTPEFYLDSDYHQFYRVITELTPEQLVHFLFRSKSGNQKQDKVLEIMHEASILRQYIKCDSLDSRRGNLNLAYEQSLKRSEDLFQKPIQDFKYLGKRSLFQEVTKYRLSIIFDTLSLMAEKGYSPEETIAELEKIRIYPQFNFQEDALLKITKRVLEKS